MPGVSREPATARPAADPDDDATGDEGKGDRTRRRLLEVAIGRFARDGYRRTSVSAIARDVGVTPAAVYAYFDGKEALFHAAVDADAATLIESARAPGRELDDLGERWLGIVAELRERLDEHPLARRVLAGLEPEAVGRLLDLPSLDALRADLAADLAAGQVGGEVRADVDAGRLALGFETLVLALLMAGTQVGMRGADERAAAALAVLEAATRPPA